MRFRINTPKIVHETIDDETIIINFDTGTYYSCRDVANRIVTLIEEGNEHSTILTVIESQYTTDTDDIRDAVDGFIARLVEEEIIVESTDERAAGTEIPAFSGSTTAFTVPKLEKYTDMQELLLLDPIHEVGEFGWPQPKS